MNVTYEEAAAAIELARQYLKHQAVTGRSVVTDDDGDFADEPPHWDSARAWAKKLLGPDGGDVDGHFGCRLCCS